MSDDEAKQWGLALLAKAKDAAMEDAARKAWDAHYFKCTPQIPLEQWTLIWKKAVGWWTVPPAVKPEATPPLAESSPASSARSIPSA